MARNIYILVLTSQSPLNLYTSASYFVKNMENPSGLSCCCCSVTQLHPTLATPWTVAHQAPLSMGFSRQEYWNGLPFPSSGDLPDPRIEPCLLNWQAVSLPLRPQGSQTGQLKALWSTSYCSIDFPHWSVGPGIDSGLLAYHLYKALQNTD